MGGVGGLILSLFRCLFPCCGGAGSGGLVLFGLASCRVVFLFRFCFVLVCFAFVVWWIASDADAGVESTLLHWIISWLGA